jgi:hypothetical protein
VVAGGLLPWTPLALVWLGPVTQFLRRRRDVGTFDLRLLLWAALPLVFYTLSVGKQPRYVLPVLPPLALLLASSIVERTQEWRGFDGVRSLPRRAAPVVVGSLLCGVFCHARRVHRAAAAHQRQPGRHHHRGLGGGVGARCVFRRHLEAGAAPRCGGNGAAVSCRRCNTAGRAAGDDTVRQMASLVTTSAPLGSRHLWRIREESHLHTGVAPPT